MKSLIFPSSYILQLILVFACTKNDPSATDSLNCVSGVIVGSKCRVFALKIDKKHAIPSRTWPKLVVKDGQNTYENIDHVIGILNLPEDLQKDGTRVFLELRKATEEESIVPCYADMPPPPRPMYFVLKADNLKCPSDSKL